MMSATYVCLAQGVARHSAAREQLQTARAQRRAREKIMAAVGGLARNTKLNILPISTESLGPVAQWIRPTEPGIAGSSPAGVIFARCLLMPSQVTKAARHLTRKGCDKGAESIPRSILRAGGSRHKSNASAGNRARVASMATMYSAARPLMFVALATSPAEMSMAFLLFANAWPVHAARHGLTSLLATLCSVRSFLRGSALHA